jgi:hypothetical protein
MFKDVDWRSAFKRAAVFTAIWLGLVYVLNTVSPGTFGVGGRQQIYALAFNAVVFFFLYALLFAFFEKRRRNSGLGQTKAQSKREEPSEPGPLKGRHNPNTSRKKSRRRSRR